jgi:hypothetical protein
LTLLDGLHSRGQEFGPPKTAPKKHGNHGAVALCSQRGRVKRGEQCLALFRCQPVTEADAETPNALDRPNTASD